jgi:hypothetical protein
MEKRNLMIPSQIRDGYEWYVIFIAEALSVSVGNVSVVGKRS